VIQLHLGQGITLDLHNLYMRPWERPTQRTDAFKPLMLSWYATTIDLSDNDLKQIPDQLRYCVHIRKLIANDNRLDKLPEFLSGASELRVVELRNNRFKQFPKCLESLGTLKRVDLRLNKISKLPWEVIRRLPKLRAIDLRDNPSITGKSVQKVAGLVGDKQDEAIELALSGQSFWLVRKRECGSSKPIVRLTPPAKATKGPSSSTTVPRSPLPFDIASVVTRDKVLDLSGRNLHALHVAQVVSTILMIHAFNQRNTLSAIPITLEEIDLSDNFIRDEGIYHILELVSLNSSTLRRLDLRRNEITCSGLHLLLQVLHDNVHLVQLNLEEEEWMPMGSTAKEELKPVKKSQFKITVHSRGRQPPNMWEWKQTEESVQRIIRANAKYRRVSNTN
jgi:Leucine-rich repeat (LRR) protein